VCSDPLLRAAIVLGSYYRIMTGMGGRMNFFLLVNCPSIIPLTADGATDLLTQVIRNILGNPWQAY
jgi:hypothetical protein